MNRIPKEIENLINNIVEDNYKEGCCKSYREDYKSVEKNIIESYMIIGRCKKFASLKDITKLIHMYSEVDSNYKDSIDSKGLLSVIKEPSKLAKEICKSVNKKIYYDFNNYNNMDIRKIYIPSQQTYIFGTNGIKLLFKNSKITQLMTGMTASILFMAFSIEQKLTGLFLIVLASILWTRFIVVMSNTFVKYIE